MLECIFTIPQFRRPSLSKTLNEGQVCHLDGMDMISASLPSIDEQIAAVPVSA